MQTDRLRDDSTALLAEGKYTADQLRDMLTKGHAIRNDNGEPSYPIGDAEDLQKAIKAVGRGGKDHDKIRAYIVRRAKALGKTGLLPDDWAASGQMKEALTESIPLVEATRGQRTGSRMRIKLINTGWGSSGHYSEAVLRQAAADRVFPAGTHMYIDHPTSTENAERPERSVRDLAAVLTSPATFEQGALYGEARVFGPYQQFLTDMAEHIGVSIRATGYAEHGQAEGREGAIITGLTEGISVDFVTKAGRGGQIVEVLESARREMTEARNIGHWLESRLHLALTQFGDDMFGDGRVTREERIAMSSAVGDALTSFAGALEKKAPQLYQRDLYDGPPEPDNSAAMAETILPAPPAKPTTEGAPMTGTPQGAPPSGGAPNDVSEVAQVRTELAETKQKLAEAELEIAKLGDQSRKLAEAEAKLAEAERENKRLLANDAARTKAEESLKESTLPKVAHAKVIAAVTGANVPLNDEGALDEAALVKSIKAAIDEQRDYLTAFAEESGMGTPSGLGGGAGPKVDVETELGEVFRSFDMSESAAGFAAKGRG
ncbi:hypothetical protein [Actinomadura rudentiformis]|uniref:Uncharacterized protein n=1 Tax=Actinomadura rudentiformis TaxID=359158 RepID=A0A6H9YMW7_9ACTN|nr:hypothetical protein [Actinomadura rudentiformis]KAB2347342.1 hypothetical protein F8566_20230 [Actinomadura rudentiformis]